MKSFIFTILMFVLSLGIFGCQNIQPIEIDTEADAYIYIPDGIRANYTDIDMFECAWCHRKKNLNRHHIIPKSANPALKNEFSNIVVLCRDCHFVLGHRCNWKKFNPDVMIIVETYTNSIVSADYRKMLDDQN